MQFTPSFAVLLSAVLISLTIDSTGPLPVSAVPINQGYGAVGVHGDGLGSPIVRERGLGNAQFAPSRSDLDRRRVGGRRLGRPHVRRAVDGEVIHPFIGTTMRDGASRNETDLSGPSVVKDVISPDNSTSLGNSTTLGNSTSADGLGANVRIITDAVHTSTRMMTVTRTSVTTVTASATASTTSRSSPEGIVRLATGHGAAIQIDESPMSKLHGAYGKRDLVNPSALFIDNQGPDAPQSSAANLLAASAPSAVPSGTTDWAATPTATNSLTNGQVYSMGIPDAPAGFSSSLAAAAAGGAAPTSQVAQLAASTSAPASAAGPTPTLAGAPNGYEQWAAAEGVPQQIDQFASLYATAPASASAPAPTAPARRQHEERDSLSDVIGAIQDQMRALQQVAAEGHIIPYNATIPDRPTNGTQRASVNGADSNAPTFVVTLTLVPNTRMSLPTGSVNSSAVVGVSHHRNSTGPVRPAMATSTLHVTGTEVVTMTKTHVVTNTATIPSSASSSAGNRTRVSPSSLLHPTQSVVAQNSSSSAASPSASEAASMRSSSASEARFAGPTSSASVSTVHQSNAASASASASPSPSRDALSSSSVPLASASASANPDNAKASNNRDVSSASATSSATSVASHSLVATSNVAPSQSGAAGLPSPSSASSQPSIAAVPPVSRFFRRSSPAARMHVAQAERL